MVEEAARLEVARRVEKARLIHEMSKRQLARHLQMDRTALRQRLSGAVEFRPSELVRTARVLGADPIEWMTGLLELEPLPDETRAA